MKNKTIAIVFSALFLVLVGSAAAMPNWYPGFWSNPSLNASSNGTLHNPAGNAALRNQTATWHGHGFGFNSTNSPRALDNNQTIPFDNQTIQQFNAAVQSGDYQAALALHQQYGIGGPLFDKLNATTFVTYSQIYGLQNQLWTLTGQLKQEIGLNESEPLGVGLGQPRPGISGGMARVNQQLGAEMLRAGIMPHPKHNPGLDSHNPAMPALK